MKNVSFTVSGTKKINFQRMGKMTTFYVERELGTKNGISRYRGRIILDGSSVRGVLSESDTRRIFTPTNKSNTSSSKMMVTS